MQSLFGLMDTKAIENPIKCGEVILPFYEGHYYVSFSNGSSSNDMVNIKTFKIKILLLYFQETICQYFPSWPQELFPYHHHHYNVTQGVHLTTKAMEAKVMVYNVSLIININVNRVLCTNQSTSTFTRRSECGTHCLRLN